ncbi:MAG: hypothetical protein HQK54_18365 [Oligoflexales bacterium]|nr:hypothetical protein [Oligoflexales bacterium]
MGRITALTTVFFLLFSFSASSFGADYVIYGTKKNFPMTNNEKDLPRDYYTNMGSRQGIKVGSTLKVIRTITTQDTINNKTSENIDVVIGRVKVIYVNDTTSVARILKMEEPDKIPVIKFNTVMVGDKVTVATE